MVHHPNLSKSIYSQFGTLGEGFLFKIQWLFCATSHGKGVVDGIGGSVKGSEHCKILSGELFKLQSK